MSQVALDTKPTMVRCCTPPCRTRTLRLVCSPSEENVDRAQQRRAFQVRCETIAWELATSSPLERAAAYESGTYTYRELSTAPRLCDPS